MNIDIEKIRKNPYAVEWEKVSSTKGLTEPFIREFKDRVKWSLISVFQVLSNEFIREFADKVDWPRIFTHQKLSEDIIREFIDKVDSFYITDNQKLSSSFIREFADRLNWHSLTSYQTLDESIIREFVDKIDLNWTAIYQHLSEPFIREFAERLDFCRISKFQPLSKEFIEEFKDKLAVEVQLKTHHDNRTLEQKRQEVQAYAKEHGLKFEDDILYAFRDHDEFGRGEFNKTISYAKGYYRDWRCNLDPDDKYSFGLGIWSTGNTLVQVRVEDWGCALSYKVKGKARVWGFEI